MSARGDATRSKLVDTTIRLVSELGYAKTTTRAIAQAAGVAEGTLYRHFPDKATLFAEAVLQQNQHVVDWIDMLPARAGTATVAANLTDCLTHLATLRADILPLELAILTDPELARVAPPPVRCQARRDVSPSTYAPNRISAACVPMPTRTTAPSSCWPCCSAWP